MDIIKITDKDQAKLAGQLIFQTDPYIYPALFADEANAVKVIAELLRIPDELFCADHIHLACESGRCAGVICAFSHGFRTSYEKWLGAFMRAQAYVPCTFKEAYDSYVHNLGLEAHPGIYLSNVCVSKENRNKGFGYRMMEQFLSAGHIREASLDVLKDNHAAVSMYRRLGFTETGEYEGFAIGLQKPRCFHMVLRRGASE